MADESYDFSGWATKANVKCTDGLTIMNNAFEANDGTRVPLVWNHKHDSPFDVLGHADLKNRGDGVYAYCKFNDTEQGQNARLLVQHGDVNAMSIFANGLKKDASKTNVMHGVIREVSLVLAGANPKALIQTVLSHSMDGYDEDELVLAISPGACELTLEHTDAKKEEDTHDETPDSDTIEHADENESEPVKEPGDNNGKEDTDMADTKKEKTVKDVFEAMTDEQKNVVYFMIGEALKGKGGNDAENDDEGGKDMKHNFFDGENETEVLSQADFDQVFNDAKRLGSFKEALAANFGEDGVIAHSIDTTGMTTATGTQTYGFNDPSMLFPEFRAMSNTPEWISRNMDWVTKVLGGVHRTPFSRIKSVFANITEDEARARGYIKGTQKINEVFTTLKRTTDPQTIYKYQTLDRDDILDITDFDVVAWIRGEMRVMLNEELARAILIGDGRNANDPYKILENHIRPIATDVPLFNTQIRIKVAANADDDAVAKAIIKGAIKGRKNYKGSGNPVLYTSEDWLTDMLLLEDGIGHKLYKTESELATALRVKDIVTVEPMEGHNIEIGASEYPLIGVIVNLDDYNVGADKGGNVTNFEDFDIKFNQNQYLIETRASGALTKPFSALTLYLDRATA